MIGRRSRRRKVVYATIGGVVTVSLLAVLLKPAQETEVKSIQVNVGSEHDLTRHNSTLTDGRESVAEAFIRARSALVAGDFAQAHKDFDEIIQTPRTKQPTLNLARFNAALCAIVEGKKEEAESYFADIKRDAEKAQNIAGVDWRDLKEFFTRLGARMSDNLGLGMERKEVAYETDSEQVLGYLAHGLAKWHFSSQPHTAAEWLNEFNRCTPKKGLEWISNYKRIVEPYLADMKIVDALGGSGDAGFATPKFAAVEEANQALAQSKATMAQLKTNGALRNQLSRRIKFTQDEIKRLHIEAAKAESARLAALRESEQQQLAELSETLPELLSGYDYSRGVELLDGLKYETPEVQNAVATRRYLWTKAKEFMTTLMADVTARGFTGTLNRESGMPLQGRLTRLDYEFATVTLERGQLQVSTESLSADSLVAVAQSMCSDISDSTDYYRRQELIAVFAKMQGLDQIATLVASQLGEENRPFRQRWARVVQSGL